MTAYPGDGAKKQPKVEREMRRFQEPGKPVYVVHLDPNGVVWCDCPAWIESARRPKTCPHLSEMVVARGDEGEYADNADMLAKNVLPPAYEMSGQERGPALQLIAPSKKKASPGRKGRPQKKQASTPAERRQVSPKRDLKECEEVFERVKAAFAALRKKGFCAVMRMQDEDSTVAWFQERPKYRALAFTCKADESAFKTGGTLILHVSSRDQADPAKSEVEEVLQSLGGGLNVGGAANSVSVFGVLSVSQRSQLSPLADQDGRPARHRLAVGLATS